MKGKIEALKSEQLLLNEKFREELFTVLKKDPNADDSTINNKDIESYLWEMEQKYDSVFLGFLETHLASAPA